MKNLSLLAIAAFSVGLSATAVAEDYMRVYCSALDAVTVDSGNIVSYGELGWIRVKLSIVNHGDRSISLPRPLGTEDLDFQSLGVLAPKSSLPAAIDELSWAAFEEPEKFGVGESKAFNPSDWSTLEPHTGLQWVLRLRPREGGSFSHGELRLECRLRPDRLSIDDEPFPGRLDPGFAELRLESIETTQDMQRYLLLYGRRLLSTDHFDEAGEVFQQGLSLGSDPAFHIELGRAQLRRGNYDEAIEALEAGLGNRPRSPSSWLLVQAYVAAAREDDAERLLSQLTTKDRLREELRRMKAVVEARARKLP